VLDLSVILIWSPCSQVTMPVDESTEVFVLVPWFSSGDGEVIEAVKIRLPFSSRGMGSSLGSLVQETIVRASKMAAETCACACADAAASDRKDIVLIVLFSFGL